MNVNEFITFLLGLAIAFTICGIIAHYYYIKSRRLEEALAREIRDTNQIQRRFT